MKKSVTTIGGHMEIMMASLISAWLIDQRYGEYPNRLHPVVWMGNLIRFASKRWPPTSSTQLIYGWILALAIPSFVAALSYWLLKLASLHWFALFILASLSLKASFALKALGDAAFLVSNSLTTGGLGQARQALGSLCSRNPDQLNEEDLINSATASVAENLCDSVIAPLFYFLLFGIPGALAYRAFNTMDAMLGYFDERRFIGRGSAKLDDLANWLPARITALVLLAAGCLRAYPIQQAWQICWRDRKNTPSPNGGWTMGMMAGLLGIQIYKPGVYTLGDALSKSTAASLKQAWHLSQLACLIFTLIIIACCLVFGPGLGWGFLNGN